VVARRLAARPPSAGRLEGGVDGDPYEVQWRAWRRPVLVRSNSVGDVVAVPGVALQCWDGCAGLTATEKTVPTGLTSRCSPV
jgi:hypothetical protein